MKKSWYVSEAENSKRNFILAFKDDAKGTSGRIVVSKDAVGDLDISEPKTVTILDKFVKGNKGNTVVNENGFLTVYYGFGASTRKYAETETKLSAFSQTLVTNEIVSLTMEEAELD